MIDLIAVIVATEGITQGIFNAGPLQPARNWILERTPWLFSKMTMTHFLDCRYCVSFWIGLLMAAVYFYGMTEPWIRIVVYAFFLQRLANWVHLVFSVLRDRQLDLRIARNRRG